MVVCPQCKIFAMSRTSSPAYHSCSQVQTGRFTGRPFRGIKALAFLSETLLSLELLESRWRRLLAGQVGKAIAMTAGTAPLLEHHIAALEIGECQRHKIGGVVAMLVCYHRAPQIMRAGKLGCW